MTDRMSEEARALTENSVGLAWKFCVKWKRRDPRLADEIESAALLGLCKAAMIFDPGRGLAFSTFAYGCMEFEVRKLYRSLRGKRQAFSCDSSIPGGGDSIEAAEDPRAEDPADRLDRSAAFAELHGALEALPERERFIVRGRKFDGLTLVEAAAELSREEGAAAPISGARIRQIEVRAMERLRSLLKGTTATAMA